MKIMIIGDVHGSQRYLDWAMNKAISFGAECAIQLGDLGFFPKTNKGFPNKKYKIPLYWVDGNHEDHSEIEAGNAPFSHMKRGSTLELGGKKFLFLGGAHSIDWKLRKLGVSWFPSENITDSDINIAKSNSKGVDIIITHDAPSFVPIEDRERGRRLTRMGFDLNDPGNRSKLSSLFDSTEGPSKWFFGHWHHNYRESIRGTDFICLPGNSSECTICLLDTEDMSEKFINETDFAT